VACRRLSLLLAALGLAALPATAETIRVATFNTALSRNEAGAFVQEMRLGGSEQAAAVAEIIQRVRPDILLLNEIDHDPQGNAADLFAEYLETDREGAAGIAFPFRFTAPVNTGVLASVDLDGDGRRTLPGDGYGWGRYPGHYGMAVLSRFPIAATRTFQTLLWQAMPDNLIPPGHYSPEAEAVLRLSSKSHWDVRIETPQGPLHLLASHPTPPVFDGPEDANGRRNADEIRFWAAYLDGADWITDDSGVAGGLGDAHFVLLGDLNADPEGGDGRRAVIGSLLAHPRLQDAKPASDGAASAPHRPATFTGDPTLATSGWGPPAGPLRVDYVLPDSRLTVTGAGVFWPAEGDPLRRLVGESGETVSSDHRLVWVDIAFPGP
jgi:endonuclease/exonuclease/phosphatase family metal-dependent hydrolase